jgi:hypothetical protein
MPFTVWRTKLEGTLRRTEATKGARKPSRNSILKKYGDLLMFLLCSLRPTGPNHNKLKPC